MRCLRAPLRTHAQACPRLCPRVLAATRDGAASHASSSTGTSLVSPTALPPRNRPRVAPPTVRRDMPPVATPPGRAGSAILSALHAVPGSQGPAVSPAVQGIPGPGVAGRRLRCCGCLFRGLPRPSARCPVCSRCGSPQKCNTDYSGYSSDKAQGIAGYSRVLHKILLVI